MVKLELALAFSKFKPCTIKQTDKLIFTITYKYKKMSNFILTFVAIFITTSCLSQDSKDTNKPVRDLMSIKVKDLLEMCKEGTNKSRRHVHKWEKCKYFDFRKFTPAQDTSVWYIDYVKVGFDKKGDIVEILTYGDIKDSRMNYNLYFYPLDNQFDIIWVNQFGPGGYEASIKELKEEWKQSMGQTLIIYDKINKVSIYFETYPDVDFRKSKYKYYFFKQIGTLYSDFMVNHKFKFMFNGNNGANQVTTYKKYSSEKGFNKQIKKYIYRYDDEDIHPNNKKVFCTLENTINDLINGVQKQGVNMEEDIDEEHLFHLPAYLPPR